jgi:hypothetical protein
MEAVLIYAVYYLGEVIKTGLTALAVFFVIGLAYETFEEAFDKLLSRLPWVCAGAAAVQVVAVVALRFMGVQITWEWFLPVCMTAMATGVILDDNPRRFGWFLSNVGTTMLALGTIMVVVYPFCSLSLQAWQFYKALLV